MMRRLQDRHAAGPRPLSSASFGGSGASKCWSMRRTGVGGLLQNAGRSLTEMKRQKDEGKPDSQIMCGTCPSTPPLVRRAASAPVMDSACCGFAPVVAAVAVALHSSCWASADPPLPPAPPQLGPTVFAVTRFFLEILGQCDALEQYEQSIWSSLDSLLHFSACACVAPPPPGSVVCLGVPRTGGRTDGPSALGALRRRRA